MRYFIGPLALLLVGLFSFSTVLPCSRVLWVAEDGQVLVGRTNDWTGKVDSAFRMFPRGIERVGAVTENPHKWTSKYGSVILSGYDMGTHEGVNEKGLSVHVLFLAEVCDFGKRDPKLEGIGIMQWAQYYLDNYATVAEAVEAQKSFKFQIEPMILPNGAATMLHISLSDKSGDSAVIEYIEGKARVHHDRRYCVMTNEPSYDKQIENLKQYRTFGGDKPLPGERKSMDRFVRAAVYVKALPKPANRDEGAAFIFSVMRNVSGVTGIPTTI
jgi:penicillin V acylase-like amidase (Ntn superfamily)